MPEFSRDLKAIAEARSKWVWGEEAGYARLKAQKRHDPRSAPDARAIAADHIAAELDRLGWTVLSRTGCLL
jgi:hypothetical protein